MCSFLVGVCLSKMMLQYSHFRHIRPLPPPNANAVIRAFEAVARAFIVQWACCMEHHRDEGVHFHMCVLLNKIQRWSMVQRHLQEVEKVVVHFSGHAGCYTAYQYVTKEDTEVLSSENHPSSVAAP